MSVFRASNSPDTDWSVPVQRGPYPPAFVDPEGPTQRIYLPEDEPEPLAEPDEPEPYESMSDESRHGRGAAFALLIASLALAVSGGAAVTAWHALGRADDAASMSVMRMPVTHLPAATLPEPTPMPSAVVSSAGPVGVAPMISGSTLRYAQEPVRMTVACGTASLLDLDQQPRVDAPEDQSDVRFDNRCGSAGTLLSIGAGALAGSHVTDPDTDRPGCADALRTSPLDPGEAVPVQKGTVLCVGTTASLIVVEVTGVGTDGSLSLRATAWTAPAPTAEVVPSDEASPGD